MTLKTDNLDPMKPLTLLILVSTLLVPVTYGQKLAFKDVPMGMSLAEFTAKFKSETPALFPTVDFGSVYSSGPVLGDDSVNLRKSGIVDAYKHPSVDTPDIGVYSSNSTIAGVRAYVEYQFYADSLAHWDEAAEPFREDAITLNKLEDSNSIFKWERLKKHKAATWENWNKNERRIASNILLGVISVKFNAINFPTVVRALVAKYGKPTAQQVGTVENGLGAQFDDHAYLWKIGDSQILATERKDSIDISEVEFGDKKIVSRADNFLKASTKKAASDL